MFKHTLLRRIAGLAALAVAGVLLAVPAPAHATPSFTVWIKNVNSGFNARVPNIAINQQAIQSSLVNVDSVHWELIHANGAALQFQNNLSLLCLGVGGNRLSGAPVIQVQCNINDPFQWWYFDPILGEGTTYHARNGGTAFYLDVQGGSISTGARLVQVPLSASQSQWWEIPAV